MPRSRRNNHPRTGFSLVEMLTAIAVLSMLMVILVSLSNHAGKIWSHGEKQNQFRQRARTALDFIGRELRCATIDLDPNARKLQFVINPSTVSSSDHNCRDTIFWQAPIATDSNKAGLAEIGYFVRWTKDSNGAYSQANLCRYFINPTDTNYLIYNQPNAWVSDSLLYTLAPADASGNYQGLFLENVLGLWIKAYQADGTSAYAGDSRSTGKLPAYVEITLVLIDENTATKLKAMNKISAIRALYSTTTDAKSFAAAIDNMLPNSTSLVSLRVNLDNYK